LAFQSSGRKKNAGSELTNCFHQFLYQPHQQNFPSPSSDTNLLPMMTPEASSHAASKVTLLDMPKPIKTGMVQLHGIYSSENTPELASLKAFFAPVTDADDTI